VHGVGGDALGGVDGGGVAETSRGADVVGGQQDRVVAAVVSYGEADLVAHCSDRPAVAVFDPVGGGEAESAVVAAGDDHISDTGPIPVGQRHLGYCRRLIEPMRAGARVQLSYEVPGGCDHDRVEPSRSVGSPSVERSLRGAGEVADMNAAVIKVEVECL
jgi:hypothetical protein